MNVLLFGATGMVGQGVLRECLRDPGVERVLITGRSTAGIKHPKLREKVLQDLLRYDAAESDLSGFDACFFCLGVSSAGMKEEHYARVTYLITTTAAKTLSRLNPGMTFIYVSAAGADSSEHGRTMWARIKGKTENALMRLPFKAVYVFRPALIEPMHGAKSRTASYRIFYALGEPLFPVLRWAFPNYVLTTEQIGRAMLAIAWNGWPKQVLESKDIAAVRPG
jgi:uncharacterized protein YbjT (DUF2867 family)